MGLDSDIRPVAAELYFLPVSSRASHSSETGTLSSLMCARARVRVVDRRGRTAEGWGETLLNAEEIWPGPGPCDERMAALQQFSRELVPLWAAIRTEGHPLEVGYAFLETVLPGFWQGFNQRHRRGREPMPWRASLACGSALDLATHDAFGHLVTRPIYETYTRAFLTYDLSRYLQPAPASVVDFRGLYPADFLLSKRRERLLAWHRVHETDPVDLSGERGPQVEEGHLILLPDWIQRDGLRCLKIRLRGHDPAWDYHRLVQIGQIALAHDVFWLAADFGSVACGSSGVTDLLDRLRDEHPRLYGMLLFVELPFGSEVRAHSTDFQAVAARKPLFLDASAHDWRELRLARQLGWTGLVVKTCMTQTLALLTACWARAHGMLLMVGDTGNPMLAQIPHLLLAAHLPTWMGVETWSMQLYPAASEPEAGIHPGLYRRQHGCVDLATVQGPGFGYEAARIRRQLPAPVVVCGF